VRHIRQKRIRIMSAKRPPACLAMPVVLLAFCLVDPIAHAGDIERGRYLVEALTACDNCHTPRGPAGYDFSSRLSGGAQTFSDKSYVVRGPNISPDRETGVGAWTDEELRAAIVDGVGRDGRLAPVMPSDSYKPLTPRDLDAIIAFLRSATPIHAPLQSPQQRSGEWTPRLMPGASAAFDDASLADKNTRASMSRRSPVACRVTARKSMARLTIKIASARAERPSATPPASSSPRTSRRIRQRASALGPTMT